LTAWKVEINEALAFITPKQFARKYQWIINRTDDNKDPVIIFKDDSSVYLR
jgi:hypothetical protein